MKVEHFFLGSNYGKLKLISRINELPIDGSIKATLTPTKSKSVRRRGLQWLWYTETAESGIGAYDTKNDVHRAAKWKWAVPILLRDDEEFCEIWPELLHLFEKDPEKMKYIVDNFVSTEGTGFAIGEYLTDYERYYREHGVPLTIPEDGLLEFAEERENGGQC